MSGNEPKDKQADSSDDSTDEEPLRRQQQLRQLRSVASVVERPQETEGAEEARVLEGTPEKDKRKVSSSLREGRKETWDYVPVEDDAACSIIVNDKCETAAINKNFADDESSSFV